MEPQELLTEARQAIVSQREEKEALAELAQAYKVYRKWQDRVFSAGRDKVQDDTWVFEAIESKYQEAVENAPHRIFRFGHWFIKGNTYGYDCPQGTYVYEDDEPNGTTMLLWPDMEHLYVQWYEPRTVIGEDDSISMEYDMQYTYWILNSEGS